MSPRKPRLRGYILRHDGHEYHFEKDHLQPHRGYYPVREDGCRMWMTYLSYGIFVAETKPIEYVRSACMLIEDPNDYVVGLYYPGASYWLANSWPNDRKAQVVWALTAADAIAIREGPSVLGAPSVLGSQDAKSIA